MQIDPKAALMAIAICILMYILSSSLGFREARQELKILRVLSKKGRAKSHEIINIDRKIGSIAIYARLTRMEQYGFIAGEGPSKPTQSRDPTKIWWITMRGATRLKYLEKNYR
ncbi:MAG: hypothetical protein JWO50_598 [Candidatus Kaiserbacteria bacterium]|nr:hypothetical protein [Candidatus Kaiserbacteria bacterium]